ncbi:MAG: hypothetical protein WC093_06860, partial [Methanoculleus sp.]
VALSLYQVYGVPAAGREDEIAHMNAVKDRFVDYKIALDGLWVNGRNGVLLSTAFELGTGSAATGGRAFAFPILTPAGSGGTVSVKSGGASLTIEAAGKEPVTIPLGSLTYQSSNNYWVDQTWTYQMGAVLLSQENRTTARVGPSLSVYNTNGNATVSITPVNITGSASLAGSGPVRIETRLRDMGTYAGLTGEFTGVNISIEAGDEGHAQAWERAFREAVRRDALNSSWYEVGGASTTAYLYITGPYTDATPDVGLSTIRADYRVSITSAASLIE